MASPAPFIPQYLPDVKHGVAFFSTNGAQEKPRAVDGASKPRVIVRSNFHQSKVDFAAKLRKNFPHACYGVFAPWDIRWYFDEYDFYQEGGKFLYEVLLHLQAENESFVSTFCKDWATRNASNYTAIMSLNAEMAFHKDDHAKYGLGFLEAALKYLQQAYVRASVLSQKLPGNEEWKNRAVQGYSRGRYVLDHVPSQGANGVSSTSDMKQVKGRSITDITGTLKTTGIGENSHKTSTELPNHPAARQERFSRRVSDVAPQTSQMDGFGGGNSSSYLAEQSPYAHPSEAYHPTLHPARPFHAPVFTLPPGPSSHNNSPHWVPFPQIPMPPALTVPTYGGPGLPLQDRAPPHFQGYRHPTQPLFFRADQNIAHLPPANLTQEAGAFDRSSSQDVRVNAETPNFSTHYGRERSGSGPKKKTPSKKGRKYSDARRTSFSQSFPDDAPNMAVLPSHGLLHRRGTLDSLPEHRGSKLCGPKVLTEHYRTSAGLPAEVSMLSDKPQQPFDPGRMGDHMKRCERNLPAHQHVDHGSHDAVALMEPSLIGTDMGLEATAGVQKTDNASSTIDQKITQSSSKEGITPQMTGSDTEPELSASVPFSSQTSAPPMPRVSLTRSDDRILAAQEPGCVSDLSISREPRASTGYNKNHTQEQEQDVQGSTHDVLRRSQQPPSRSISESKISQSSQHDDWTKVPKWKRSTTSPIHGPLIDTNDTRLMITPHRIGEDVTHIDSLYVGGAAPVLSELSLWALFESIGVKLKRITRATTKVGNQYPVIYAVFYSADDVRRSLDGSPYLWENRKVVLETPRRLSKDPCPKPCETCQKAKLRNLVSETPEEGDGEFSLTDRQNKVKSPPTNAEGASTNLPPTLHQNDVVGVTKSPQSARSWARIAAQGSELTNFTQTKPSESPVTSRSPSVNATTLTPVTSVQESKPLTVFMNKEEEIKMQSVQEDSLNQFSAGTSIEGLAGSREPQRKNTSPRHLSATDSVTDKDEKAEHTHNDSQPPKEAGANYISKCLDISSKESASVALEVSDRSGGSSPTIGPSVPGHSVSHESFNRGLSAKSSNRNEASLDASDATLCVSGAKFSALDVLPNVPHFDTSEEAIIAGADPGLARRTSSRASSALQTNLDADSGVESPEYRIACSPATHSTWLKDHEKITAAILKESAPQKRREFAAELERITKLIDCAIVRVDELERKKDSSLNRKSLATKLKKAKSTLNGHMSNFHIFSSRVMNSISVAKEDPAVHTSKPIVEPEESSDHRLVYTMAYHPEENDEETFHTSSDSSEHRITSKKSSDPAASGIKSVEKPFEGYEDVIANLRWGQPPLRDGNNSRRLNLSDAQVTAQDAVSNTLELQHMFISPSESDLEESPVEAIEGQAPLTGLGIQGSAIPSTPSTVASEPRPSTPASQAVDTQNAQSPMVGLNNNTPSLLTTSTEIATDDNVQPAPEESCASKVISTMAESHREQSPQPPNQPPLPLPERRPSYADVAKSASPSTSFSRVMSPTSDTIPPVVPRIASGTEYSIWTTASATGRPAGLVHPPSAFKPPRSLDGHIARDSRAKSRTPSRSSSPATTKSSVQDSSVEWGLGAEKKWEAKVPNVKKTA